jgi:hypothetical protein
LLTFRKIKEAKIDLRSVGESYEPKMTKLGKFIETLIQRNLEKLTSSIPKLDQRLVIMLTDKGLHRDTM